jgi:hypothetical protein
VEGGREVVVVVEVAVQKTLRPKKHTPRRVRERGRSPFFIAQHRRVPFFRAPSPHAHADID